jgi:hypothetical protein
MRPLGRPRLDLLVLGGIEVLLALVVLWPWLAHDNLLGGDGVGHLYEIAYTRDVLSPHWLGWNPHVFLGYAVGLGYPPLSRLLVLLVQLVTPLLLAYKLVTAAAVLATPLAAWRLGRRVFRPLTGGAPEPWGPLAVVGLVALMLAIPSGWLGLSVALGGNLESSLGAGMLANALGILLLLTFLEALTHRDRPAAVALRLALVILGHFVYGLVAILGLAVALLADLLAKDPEAARARFAAGVVAALLAGCWLIPLMAGLSGMSADPVGFDWSPASLAIVTLGTVAAVLTIRRRSGPPRLMALLHLVLLASALLAEAVGVPTHYYRLTPVFMLTGGLPLVSLLPRAPRVVMAVAALSLALAAIALRPPPTRGNPPLDLSAAPRDPGRLLVMAPDLHAPGALAIPMEVQRVTGVDVSHGISMESAPNARYLYYTLAEVSRVFPIWTDYVPARAGRATLPWLRARLELFGIEGALTDVRLGAFFGDPSLDQRARFAFDYPDLTGGNRPETFFLDPSRRRLRYHRYDLGPAPLAAPLTRAPVFAPDLEAAARAWFPEAQADARPCACDPADFPVTPARTPVQAAYAGRERVEIDTGSAAPQTFVLKIAHHPFWRPESDEVQLSEIAPHLMLVRGAGAFALVWDPAPWPTLGLAATSLGLLLLLALGWSARRRRGGRA